jgi:demethylspheroidene O-methyltransferase
MPFLGWRDRWIDRRNRLLSDPRFQRWAADFPLTRPIARARARGLFDLVAGFVYSQTLETCVRLGLFEALRNGPLTTDALAKTFNLREEPLERLLGAAKALNLVERLGPRRWTLGMDGAALLGNAGLTDMIVHHRHLYADLTDGVELLRRDGGHGDLAAYWPYATAPAARDTPAEDVSAYSALMAASQPTVAADILKAYPIRRHRRLLDVGGGEGVFLGAAGGHAPALQLTLFDLPAVTERARARLTCAGLIERTDIVAGDFLADPLPPGADLITLVRILHDHDDAGVVRLLQSARAALAPGGTLLIAEPMSAAPRADRVADVYFAFYLLAMGRGRARTPAQITAFLKIAGFSRVRRLKTRSPFLLRILVAQP